jgi:hypothetical protein
MMYGFGKQNIMKEQPCLMFETWGLLFLCKAGAIYIGKPLQAHSSNPGSRHEKFFGETKRQGAIKRKIEKTL